MKSVLCYFYENIFNAFYPLDNKLFCFFLFISEKYSVYEIQVSARTRIGEGPKSDNITGKTNEDRKSYFPVVNNIPLYR